MKTQLLNPAPRRKARRGFSLVEMMTAVAVFSMVMVLVFQMLEKTTNIWKTSKDSVSEFKDARVAFEAITRRLSQATLNTYWQIEMFQGQTSNVPVARQYQRMSELHFVSGPAEDIVGNNNLPTGAGPRSGHCVFFQAPTGLTYTQESRQYLYTPFQNALNSWGYFVEFNSDQMDRPSFLNNLRNAPTPRVRFRLMEFVQPLESSLVFRTASQINTFLQTAPNGTMTRDQTYEWFKNPTSAGVNFPGNYPTNSSSDNIDTRNVRVVADNILALVVLPTNTVDPNRRGNIAPDYIYDTRSWLNKAQGNVAAQAKSRNQLPPIVEVLMIALDESAMRRMNAALNITNSNEASRYPFYRRTLNLFKNAQLLDRDLAELREVLAIPTGRPAIPISYRIFRTTVRIRESRWGGGGADSLIDQ
jgi:uncharacterized protein (TIGR02599 family)